MGRPVIVGRVTRAHGVRGEVLVHRFGEIEGIMDPGAEVELQKGTRREILTVQASRPHKNSWIVSFEEVADRDMAEAVAGGSLLVDSEALPSLEEGTYYLFQLVGLEVVTGEGKRIGRVKDIAPTGAHDLLVIEGREGEILIPSVKPFVRSVDLVSGRVEIEAMPGLLE
jgi:16S rRNA processing protein RimM